MPGWQQRRKCDKHTEVKEQESISHLVGKLKGKDFKRSPKMYIQIVAAYNNSSYDVIGPDPGMFRMQTRFRT